MNLQISKEFCPGLPVSRITRPFFPVRLFASLKTIAAGNDRRPELCKLLLENWGRERNLKLKALSNQTNRFIIDFFYYIIINNCCWHFEIIIHIKFVKTRVSLYKICKMIFECKYSLFESIFKIITSEFRSPNILCRKYKVKRFSG